MQVLSINVKLGIWYKRRLHLKIEKQSIKLQEKTLKSIIAESKKTQFGQKHGFEMIDDYESFKENVPLREYPEYKEFIDQHIQKGDVLFPGKALYLAFNSQTTNAQFKKVLPISKKMLFANLKTSILMAFHTSDLYQINTVSGNLYLTGNPNLENYLGYKAGMLSAIYRHQGWAWLKKNVLPSIRTSSIEDFELKLFEIAKEAKHYPLVCLAGTPPWMIMLLEKMQEQYDVKTRFPNFKILTYGGNKIGPYKKIIKSVMRRPVNYYETFAATEGFIAYQYFKDENDLMLNTNSGLFFEFLAIDDYYEKHWDRRLNLSQIDLEKPYVLYITNTSGLYAFCVGDIVRFHAKDPYRLKIIGRTKYFIQIERGKLFDADCCSPLYDYLDQQKTPFLEFSFAPGERPYSLALAIEMDQEHLDPQTLEIETQALKDYLNVRLHLGPDKLSIVLLKKGAFYRYMQRKFKVGGQFKIPRLTHDREMLTELLIEKV